jgi:hypothetical protein
LLRYLGKEYRHAIKGSPPIHNLKGFKELISGALSKRVINPNLFLVGELLICSG